MRLVRIGILAIIAFAVLSHGAVEPWARGILETAAGALLVLWAVLFLSSRKENEIVLPPLFYPLAALTVLVTVQLLFHLTASAYSTRTELQLMLSMLILFFLTAQSFRTLRDWRAFAWFVMLFAFLVAGFGILQHLTFNGKLYWFRELYYGGIPFGPYVNRNHFAGFAELVLPMSLVPLLLGRVRRERLVIVGILAILPVSALLLSASRGGIISLAAELTFLILVLLLRRTAGRIQQHPYGHHRGEPGRAVRNQPRRAGPICRRKPAKGRGGRLIWGVQGGDRPHRGPCQGRRSSRYGSDGSVE